MSFTRFDMNSISSESFLDQDTYNEQIDMWSVGCIYAELLQMLARAPVSGNIVGFTMAFFSEEGTHTEDAVLGCP